MLDMLNEDARAAIGKVKSLQSQGVPQDQIEAQMIDAARNGLLPISVAFAAQKALQRSQQQPAQAPQGTVVGEMLTQLGAQRQAGIAGLPNPTMDNANFAGGGIIAMAKGGPPPPPYNAYRERLEAARAAEAAAAAEATKAAAARAGTAATGSIAPEVAAGAAESAGLLSRVLGFVPKHPLITAGLFALPMAYDWYKKRQEQGKPEPTPTSASPTAAPAAGRVDTSKYDPKPGEMPENESDALGKLRSGVDMGGYNNTLAAVLAQYRGDADPSKLKSKETYAQEHFDLEKKFGIGEANESAKNRLEAKRKQLSEEKESSLGEDLAYGFRNAGMQHAMQGGKTLDSLLIGLAGGLNEHQAHGDRLKAASDKLDEQQYALDTAHEAQQAAGIKEGEADYEHERARIDKYRDMINEAQLHGAEFNIQQQNIGATEQLRLRIAQISAAARGTKAQKAADVLQFKAIQAMEHNDAPALKQIMDEADNLAYIIQKTYGPAILQNMKDTSKANQWAALGLGTPQGATATPTPGAAAGNQRVTKSGTTYTIE